MENNNLSFLPLFTNQCNDRYVFKRRFPYYSDMVKPTDQETIAIEKSLFIFAFISNILGGGS